jgi:predicted nucleic acid-binding protein
MLSRGQTAYWDANVFLSYINGEPSRLPTIDTLLQQSSNGDFTVVTSTISLTEVAFAEMEKLGGALDEAVEQRIDALFADRSVVSLIEFHEGVARDARRLMRRAMVQGLSLKPPDAIHLASALRLGVDMLHTYDRRMHGYGNIVGFPIAEPATATPTLL